MTPGESRVVADGDTVRSISLEEGVEVWQVLDARGKVLQLPGMLAARRPLVPGERVRLTEKDLVELAEDGSLDFSGEEEIDPSEPYGEDLALPEADPRFDQHFTAGLYRDPGDEFSPFGSDEGADAFAAIETLPRWALSRPLTESLRLVYGPGVDADLARTGLEDTRETDQLLIGGAFAVLYLTGTLDARGLEIAEASVLRQIERYGLRDTLRCIRDDLHAFSRVIQRDRGIELTDLARFLEGWVTRIDLLEGTTFVWWGREESEEDRLGTRDGEVVTAATAEELAAFARSQRWPSGFQDDTDAGSAVDLRPAQRWLRSGGPLPAESGVNLWNLADDVLWSTSGERLTSSPAAIDLHSHLTEAALPYLAPGGVPAVWTAHELAGLRRVLVRAERVVVDSFAGTGR